MTSNPSGPKAHREQSTQSDEEFPVVGLGASAGGIQALKEFFGKVSRDSGMAYVVILHMSPAHESKLAEILQVNTKISVTQVTGRVRVVPNHVYVIPPNQNLEMTDGHLDLTHMIGVEERRSPVDLFFRTLAATNERRAVSVILSGSGADGSVGLKRIKEHGGVVFVQDPLEAEYSDMPRNAIATGVVDYILPVSEIPAKIVSFNKHRGSLEIPEVPPEVPGNDEEVFLQEVFSQLRSRTGHDFSNYKRGTILRRLERRIGIRELSGLDQYVKYLKDTPEEAQVLVNDLLISVTNFFRDPESLDSLARDVLPEIVEGIGENDPIRVWVPGCATGEEAYTLAILLSEVVSQSNKTSKLQLFATDLDAEAISAAREGFYTDAEVADVSAVRLKRFFVKESHGYRVRRDLREAILFAVHNLIKDPPFSHVDLISCRNLLIYLNRTAQSRVIEIMHFALNQGGYLLLGASESINGNEFFAPVNKDQHIFRAKPTTPRTTLPVPEITVGRLTKTASEREPITAESQAAERLSYIDLHLRLLEQFAPSSVVVNEDYEILHVSDRAGRFLRFSGGEPSKNLLRVVLPELRMELRATLYQAIQTRTNVESTDVLLKTEAGEKVINLIVRPVLREHGPVRGFILVIFQEATVPADKVSDVVKTSEPVARRLEAELVHFKAQLRATVEQYEVQQEELRASNEELQAMNEELRSAAEELETSKEELKSMNEELITVNQELKVKIEELSQANNDFSNLINSTEIGTIFLDRSLKVKFFTPRARDTFNLISTDAGRSILDITNKLAYEDLSADIKYVLKTLRGVEREVKNISGSWYLMKILPYRTTDDHIDGVVVTLIDIGEIKVAQNDLRQARGELEDKVAERTGNLTLANESLRHEVDQRRLSEASRIRLVGQLISAQEEERTRLARDLHDQLGEQLTALRINLERMQQSSTVDEMKPKLQELLKITRRLDADVDFLAWELRPAVLDDLGLTAALGNYVSQWANHVDKVAEFHTTGVEDHRLPYEIENNLYRIAQEALNNVAKHSHGTRVDVLFERRDHLVVLIVEDNGKGFSVEETDELEGLGLMGMRERAAVVGGTLEIESAPNKGTTIFVRIPLPTDIEATPNE